MAITKQGAFFYCNPSGLGYSLDMKTNEKQNQADKNTKISGLIIAKMLQGMSIEAAYDYVLGPGAYLKTANECYDNLKKQNG